jgi:hypothetical protein
LEDVEKRGAERVELEAAISRLEREQRFNEDRTTQVRWSVFAPALTIGP